MVRQSSAKALFIGSIPIAASNIFLYLQLFIETIIKSCSYLEVALCLYLCLLFTFQATSLAARKVLVKAKQQQGDSRQHENVDEEFPMLDPVERMAVE